MATPGPEVPPNYVTEKSDWHSDTMIRTRRTGVDPFLQMSNKEYKYSLLGTGTLWVYLTRAPSQ